MIQWTPQGLDFDGDHDGITCATVYGDGNILMHASWNRVLTPEEIQQLVKDPWCFCQRRPRVYRLPWYLRLWKHLFTWARLWWRVAVRWGRGIE